jgi:hypothetical protein
MQRDSRSHAAHLLRDWERHGVYDSSRVDGYIRIYVVIRSSPVTLRVNRSLPEASSHGRPGAGIICARETENHRCPRLT